MNRPRRRGPERWRSAAIALALGLGTACAPHTPEAPRERAEPWPDPECAPLPERRPAGARVAISRRDGESMEHTLDVVFVDDAACPRPPPLAPPECIRPTPEAMDAIWAELRAIELHRIAQARHGECIHCGGPWISVTWPGGGCERGEGVFHEVERASWERFDRAVRFLEGIVRLVHAREGAADEAG